MSRSKFKVTKGLAHVIATGEPVYVNDIDGDNANITRLIQTASTSEYQDSTMPVEQLETRYELAKRTIEFDDYVQSLREESAAKKYQLPQQMKLVLEEQAAKNNGTPTLN